MDRVTIAGIIIIAVLVIGIGIYAYQGSIGGPQDKVLMVATTTSLEDTGLLKDLEAAFEKKYPSVDLRIVSGGSGIALEYGKKGDADIILVHDKTREEQFVKDGYGTKRIPFAYNYFWIVGPKNDPAGIKGLNATEAFKKIADDGGKNPSQVKFVSRGDNSGTNSREIKIWNQSGLNYNGTVKNATWYIESGKGMGDTLIIANEKQSYTLSDSGTFLAFQGNVTLVPLITQGKSLLNVYSTIPVNPEKVKGVNIDMANKFAEFLVSKEGQDIIANYGKQKYGQPLFTALYGQPEPT